MSDLRRPSETSPPFKESAGDVSAVERPGRKEVDQAPVEVYEQKIVDEQCGMGIETARLQQQAVIHDCAEMREEPVPGGPDMAAGQDNDGHRDSGQAETGQRPSERYRHFREGSIDAGLGNRHTAEAV